MSGRIRRCSSHRRITIEGWELAAAPPGATAATAPPADLDWRRATVPGTVASSLAELGEWSLDSTPRNFDAEDWWYRARFDAGPAAAGESIVLGFDGLATLAEVWLNGAPLFRSDNMFQEHRCEVGALLGASNELLVRFASLDAHLQARRPRPRWRTPMVRQQQLRWVRTTLLGRTPGWSPPAAPVGPWRPVWLERRRLVAVGESRLQSSLAEDGSGRIALTCEVALLGGTALTGARLVAERAGRRHEAPLRLGGAGGAGGVEGELRIEAPDLWWPHTHGEPALYGLQLRLAIRDPASGSQSVDVDVEIELGSIGFRRLHLEREGGDFALSVNGRRVFCRGACWTPLDPVSLQSPAGTCDEALAAVREAGMNMLRIAGSLVYEDAQFLDLCDAGGILLWQDFMFANMDYPAADPAFMEGVRLEAGQQLARLQARPALAVLCGNSEGGQQAAMSGAPRALWSPPLFESELAALALRWCADVPYCPSSTHGGAFPHQPSAGVTSYYGVGAYLLPLSDARRSELRFASECLAFANVPEAETLSLLGEGALRCHHPRWKERVPRDLGAGWDFDDVREYYQRELYGLDPATLRYADHDRYLRLARAASGEVMAASFAEWRRARSRCRGALVLFLRDLWPGAGWGVLDSTGLPKAAYYYLKRTLQPLALWVSDEANNGLAIHAANDAAAGVRGRLELRLYRFSEPVGQPAVRDLAIGAGATIELPATELFEGFVDLSYAFRFGPPSYDVLSVALLREDDGMILAQTFHFPLGLPNRVEGDVGLTAAAAPGGPGRWALTIQTRKFAQSVHVEMPGFVADDQYFHMAPKTTRVLELRRRSAGAAPGERAAPPQGLVHALNAAWPAAVTFKTAATS